MFDEGAFRLHWKDVSDHEIATRAVGTDPDDDAAVPVEPSQAPSWAANKAVERLGGRRDNGGWFWLDPSSAISAMRAAQEAAIAAAAVPAWQWEARAAGWGPVSEIGERCAEIAGDAPPPGKGASRIR